MSSLEPAEAIWCRRMPSNIMDQRRLSSFHLPSPPSSFFSEEIRLPSERQFGLWKTESELDHYGTEGMPLMSGIQSVSLSPQEKLRPMGGNSVECLQLPQAYGLKEQKTKISLEHHLIGAESTTGLSMTSWRAHNQGFGSRPSLYVQPVSQFVEGNKVGLNVVQYENDLFSSSLSEMFDKKLSFSSNDIPFGQSVDTFGNEEPFESLEEIEAQTIGSLLPHDDDLLSGVIDDLEYIARPNSEDDMEDDLFCSGGGMELEADDRLNSNKASDFVGGGASNGHLGRLSSSFAAEHPYGEHPSRTLFVRNINSNVEDVELRDLFEQYGDIRILYTACKHRGFVMISYYDIRAAQNAMRALQNKPLRRRNLAIHFSIPKDNPSEKDSNQGTLVVFNLDSSVSNDDLHQIFGVYGEVKEIRETPHRHHHKFIEFYDVRAAEAALHALNKSDIAGKRIKLEPSRPGGARRLIQQSSPDLEKEEFSGRRQGSVPSTLPSECFGSITLGADTFSGLDNLPIQGLLSAVRAPTSPVMKTTSHGIASTVAHNSPPPVTLATVGKHSNQSGSGNLGHSLGQRNFGYQCAPIFHPHSLPEYHDPVNNGILFHSPSTMSAMDFINSRPADGINNRHIHHRNGSGGLNNHSFGLDGGAFGVMGNGSCPLQEHQYARNSSESHHHHLPGPMIWQNSPSFVNSIPSLPPQQMHGVPRAPSHMPSTILPLHHHYVGSAPAVDPSLWENRHSYAGDSMEKSAFHPGSIGTIGFSSSSPLHALELASRSIFPHAGGNCADPSMSSAHVGIPSPQQRCHMFHGRNMPGSYDAPNDRVRSRRSDASANQADNKKLYELDIDRIMHGADSRTTLMIKNIPNKYTSKMLLATIDEHQRGTYDFIYLPIDFKNKCNVGYAFINMIDPQHIIPFFQAFNGKKWEKFNSEKVASLAYARIQGKAALIAHFQNSSLMNEDKRCRPILFHTDGPNAGDQEPFPMGVNVRSRPGRSRTAGNEEVHQGSPSTSANGEGSYHATHSSGSTKEFE